MAKIETATQEFITAPFAGVDDFARPWGEVDLLALPSSLSDKYLTGFAHSTRCVEAALRLRYEIFNIELEEGLASSDAAGLDRDEYDEQMTHLVLLERKTHRVVGTYRLQSGAQGVAARGIYSAQEYDLGPLEPYIGASVELGRACLAFDHRAFRAVVSIWLGIGAFMNAYNLRYLFGCCSLTTTDPLDGWRALRTLRESDSLHRDLYISVRDAYSCGASPANGALEGEAAYKLPKLFRTYIRLGAKVISEPALDREFGTVDFLVLQDGKGLTLSRLDVIK